VVIAAIVITLTGYTRADSLASIFILVLILPRAWSLLRDVIDVLLESTPAGVDLDEVREHIGNLPGGSRRARPPRVDHQERLRGGVGTRRRRRRLHREGRSVEVLDALGECLGDHFDVD
jgi:cobalt-zinc-cadmium efflux system protein